MDTHGGRKKMGKRRKENDKRIIEKVVPEDTADSKVEWKYGGCQACMGLAPCPVRVKVIDGRVVKIEGQKIPEMDGKLCAKGHALISQLYRPDRIRYPMRRIGKKGEGKFKRITWDEAFTEIASVLKKYRDEGHPEYVHMAYGCGHIGNIPMYQYFSKVYGTPNFSHHHGDTCDGAGWTASQITGSVGMPDYRNAKYVLEVAHNPLGGGTAPVQFSTGAFNEAIRKGTKIVVVDPRQSETAAIPGTEWVPIKPGTDGAFFLSLINALIVEKLYDEDFLLKYTNAPILIKPDGYPLRDVKENYIVWDTHASDVKSLDEAISPSLFGAYELIIEGSKKICKTAFQLLLERVAVYTPQKASEITTIPAEKIVEIAADIGAAKPSVATNWNAAHSCFYTNSMQTWRLRHILAMLLGSYDVQGGMVFPELDNVQAFLMGSGSTTTTPQSDAPTIFQTAMPPIKSTKPISAKNIELNTDTFRYPYTNAIPKFTRRGIQEGYPYPIKAMIVYGNALLNTHTHTQEYRRALEKEDLFLVAIDIWPNDHIDYADIVLPDATSLERLEVFTALWENGMRVIIPLLPVVGPLYDTKDISDIYIGLAEKLGLKEYFNFTKEEWFDAQLKPIGIDRKYLEEHGVYYELTERHYYRFPYKLKPKTPTCRLEIYSTLAPILELFSKTKDPHADPLPNYIPLYISEPRDDNEFYLLSAKCAITETSLSQDNAYLMEDYIDGLGLTKLWINADKASKLGIKSDDMVRIWSEFTGAEGVIKAKVTEGVHPSSVFAFVGFGHKAKMMAVAKGKEGINVNEFIPDHMELISGTAACQEALIKIQKFGR
jgi:thiosulfate reductase / polysulfide reductase chain A